MWAIKIEKLQSSVVDYWLLDDRRLLVIYGTLDEYVLKLKKDEEEFDWKNFYKESKKKQI